jgi:hypothetical protein
MRVPAKRGAASGTAKLAARNMTRRAWLIPEQADQAPVVIEMTGDSTGFPEPVICSALHAGDPLWKRYGSF